MAFSHNYRDNRNYSTREILSIIDKIDEMNKRLKKVEKETLSDNALLSILTRISKLEMKVKNLENNFKKGKIR